MVYFDYVQCLLFVVHERQVPDLKKSCSRHLTRSEMKGYALLPRVAAYNDLCRIFSKSGVNLLSGNCPPELIAAVKSDRVEMVEVLIEERTTDAGPANSIPCEKAGPLLRCLQVPASCLFGLPVPRAEVPADPPVRGDVVENGLCVCVEPINLLMVSLLFPGIQFGESKRDLSVYNACSVMQAENLEVIKTIATHKLDLRHRHASIGNLLLFAVERSIEPLVRWLLEKGANRGVQLRDGTTLLHAAVSAGSLPVFNLILEWGANVNAVMTGSERQGVTPLHLALHKKRSGMVKALLDNGALVNADSRMGNVLYLAIRGGTDSLACVLSHCPDLRSVSNQTAFRSGLKSLTSWEERKVRLLIDYGFEVVEDDARELFFKAVTNDCCDIAERLLQYGASVDQRSTGKGEFFEMPLHVAVTRCHKDMTRLLIKCGADVNAEDSRGDTPLRRAVQCSNTDAVRVLLASGVRVQDDPLVLFVAITKQIVCIEICEILLQNGADVHAANDEGMTPVMVAASAGQGEAMQLLCRHGARIDLNDAATIEQFTKSIERGSSNVVEVFVENGFGIKSKITDFFLSALKRRPDFVYFLLRLDSPGINIFDNIDILKAANQCKCPHTAKMVLELGYFNLDLIARSGILEPFVLDAESEALLGHRYQRIRDRLQRIREFVGKHVVMARAANLRVKKANQSVALPSWPWESGFAKDCEMEVAALKAEMIADSNVTLYDVLDATLPEIVNLTRNTSIVEYLETLVRRNEFPIYSDIILYKFCKGHYRRKLLDKGLRMCDVLFKGSGLSREIKEKILDYLSNQSLLVFNNVCPLPSEESFTASDV